MGVLFTDSSVTNVELPPDLATTLQNATTFDAMMRKQIKSQEFELKKANDHNDLLLNELNLKNDRAAATEAANKERLLIELDKAKFAAEQARQLAVIKANEDALVAKRR